ncbi:3-deoxy-D-manno-octulosonate 8-phosphate phosphatase (KDO 8-P phosphatase) [Parapedobacter composti]|uniref:3-deoxy-D-manno-octulosonate 8-phosphate phosphatase (KDO 8-P phosphatase) n=1 Tax=Parapedobacter composti TaxID=623281 RepID=A0A1I1LGG8_9SPHI|nr:hypothetical protein [Parapedobacter composti]SFC72129.1 3-deoxy-D-manno-octulosonate 8-phosphate phosphatase (KDO 8-P phosphatase) [Parapedobacter composti]
MIFDKFKRVKGFMFAADGVLTGGVVQFGATGGALRSFHVKDCYAMQLAVNKGYPLAAVTQDASASAPEWLKGIGVSFLHAGADGNAAACYEWLSQVGLDAADVLYMGYDVPDLARLQSAGLATCPADAVEDVKAAAAYVSFCSGGNGALRDVIEKVMRLQGTWNGDEHPGRLSAKNA